MEPECLMSNVVLVYNRSILDDFDIDEIKEKIELAYADKELNLGNTEVSNFKAVYSTSAPLMQVIAQDNRLVISDNTLRSSQVSVDFVRLLFNIQALINTKGAIVSQFGFNFSFAFKPSQLSAVLPAIQQKYFTSTEAIKGEVSYMLPNYSYMAGDNKYIIRYDLEQDSSGEPLRVVAACNNTLQSVSFPADAAALQTLFQENMTNLFNEVSCNE